MSHRTARQKLLDSVLPKLDDFADAENQSKSIPALVDDVLSNKTTDSAAHPPALVQRVKLANTLAEMSDGNEQFMTRLMSNSEVTTLRDVALNNPIKIDLTPSQSVQLRAAAASSTQTRELEEAATVSRFQRRLFQRQPSAVLQRMISDSQIEYSQPVRAGILSFFEKQPNFDIRKTSIQKQASEPGAFNDSDLELSQRVRGSLQDLQLVQSLSPGPEPIPVLLKAGFRSALQVSSIPQSKFVQAFGNKIGEATAHQIHDHAMKTALRNEHALVQLHDAIKGTGLAIIDGSQDLQAREKVFRELADKNSTNINLEELFGGMDFCECDDCTSMTSPAAYFVDLLQYLRNNNLDSSVDADGIPKFPNTGNKGYADTVLEKLFRRRPDLQHLELTCENTNTLIPYIDLVNEVLESFIVHEESYAKNWSLLKQTEIDVFNTHDEGSNEQLAQAQSTNYRAYCILRQAVYPLSSLPYHEPLDAIGIYLGFLKTSRAELLETFQRPFSPPSTVPPIPQGQFSEMESLHGDIIDRAIVAESLGIIQEEYIIITRQAFWGKRYFEIMTGTRLSTEAYEQQIGVKPVKDYWGYHTNDALLSDDKTEAVGLRFVKKQFLRRSGMTYPELVDLVKTKYLNPSYPTGQALPMLQSIRFSYRVLQTLIVEDADNRKDKFKLLIEFLIITQPWVDMYDIYASTDKQTFDCKPSIGRKEIAHWVYQWFECLGDLIVLESGQGPMLPIEGEVVYIRTELRPQVVSRVTGADLSSVLAADDSTNTIEEVKLGILKPDGRVVNDAGHLIALVGLDSRVYTRDGGLLSDKHKDGTVYVMAQTEGPRTIRTAVGAINKEGYLIWRDPRSKEPAIARWSAIVDTCNIDKVRLVHLDGSSLSLEEWDRIQRFVRLWRRLGFTIDETDNALWGLARTTSTQPPPNPADGSNTGVIGFGDFAPENCHMSSDNSCQIPRCDHRDGCNCDTETIPPKICESVTWPDISPEFVKEVAAVKKFVEMTGIELIQALSLWAPISISGQKSLYSRLFLTHNLIGVDDVFKGDVNGNYLTKSTKISEHVPVILAALRIKQEGFDKIVDATNLKEAELNLNTISVIYRYALLSQTLKLNMQSFLNAIKLFGNPFLSATAATQFVEGYNSMSAQGFTIQQLAYVINDFHDPLKSLAPATVAVLKAAKTLFDGLSTIDAEHPDFQESQTRTITADAVSKKTTVLYDASICEKITGLLEGTRAYTTSAPINLAITIPPSLKGKVSYFDPVDAIGGGRRAKLTVTGILTEDENGAAKAMSSHPDWAAALIRVKKQALAIFTTYLADVFPDHDQAIEKLLAGDVIVPDSSIDPGQPNPSTSHGKRAYFLQYFMPYLRDRVADQLVSTTMSGQAGISSLEITMLLLTEILKDAEGEAALKVLKSLKKPHSPSFWTGYAIPPTSDSYTFIGYGTTTPDPILLDGESIPFTTPQEDPADVWFTQPKSLTGGRLYYLHAAGGHVPALGWMTQRETFDQIPPTALMPDYATQAVREVFTKVQKAAIIINGFKLSFEEIGYIHQHKSDFGEFDLNEVKLEPWKRILAYGKLRDSLPVLEKSLLDLFKWAQAISNPAKPNTLRNIAGEIAQSTRWNIDQLEILLGPNYLNLKERSLFKNEIPLMKIQKTLEVVDKVGADIQSLYKWANPMAKFWPSHDIAEEIRNLIRSRYSLDDWEQAVKPLHDQHRMNQRDALVAYLVVQEELAKWGVVDADSLFEFFLIDVQMGACLKTSRMKQAISTVQLFVQRCMLGLEEKYGVKNDALDQTRWPALSKETIRTANVKVLLTPENFIVPSLRDDKSPIYRNLENEILQKDISPTALKDCLTTYLFNLDQVANLQVQGMFQDTDQNRTLYIVGKSRSNPYKFFYRTYQTTTKFWTPWDTVPVDIPSFQVDATSETRAFDGSYVVPRVWQNRFLIFFAEFSKKTVSQPLGNSSLANATPDKIVPFETWEIKLGWTELRNGKWTQKQITSDSIMENATKATAPAVDGYSFVSRVVGKLPTTFLSIDVYKKSSKKAIGRFEFKGSQVYAATADSSTPDLTWGESTSFHLTGGSPTLGNAYTMYCFQREAFESNASGELLVKTFPYASFPVKNLSASTITIEKQEIPFSHTFSHALLSTINTSSDLLPVFQTLTSVKEADRDIVFGKAGNEPGADGRTYPTYNELSSPYALNNWEFGFHAPMQFADALFQSQQFDAALKMCHYVFDPYENGATKERVWNWKPFGLVSSENVLEALFNSLKPGQPADPGGQITQWRDNPFMPHSVARTRPAAYMKWTVMKYLEILIAYGDYYFRQNSLEAVPLAIQLYVLASHIYGPRGQRIPKRGKVKPQTYYSLLDKWDAISNAVVALELAFPFSNQTTHPFAPNGKEIMLANIFGIATARYFCIPDNPQLRALRDLIDDRLYKIRHCQDIDGNAISLALWDPPLDPMQLVNAMAQGLSLSSVLNDLNAPMPNYRFYFLLQKAIELCTEVRAMGDKLLLLKEKRDGLALELLKSAHENNVQKMLMEIRKLQVDEANKTIDSLRVSRSGAHYRYKWYSSLGGLDLPDLMENDDPYKPATLKLTKPSADGDLVLTPTEKNEFDEAGMARDRNKEIADIEIHTSIMESLPSVNVSVQPWGIGLSLGAGPQNFAANLVAFARYIRTLSEDHNHNAANSSKKVSYGRQQQERVQLANSAGFEVKGLDAQIAVQKVKVAAAGQEMANQQKLIDQATEVADFLKNKYTNDELYSWIEGSLKGLLYQTYSVAYDLAKKAEAAYIFERGPQASPFIKFGYWNVSRDGLQSGEQLYLALKKMEAAYQNSRGYDFEIVKPISLRQLNPIALLELREKSSCNVDLPEMLFDLDFPGHYFRRIKSVALTIPCVVGPYTSVNCTLRLLGHRYRHEPSGTADKKSYPEQTDAGPDPRFKTGAIPIDSIAVSTGQNDSGVFELNFRDERYIPFEGAGVISSWRIELPSKFKPFDYNSITDVIMTVRYVSKDGGERLKTAAMGAVGDFVASTTQPGGFVALFDLKSEFASEWARATRAAPVQRPGGSGPPPPPPEPRSLVLKDLHQRLPFFTKATEQKNILAREVMLLTTTNLPPAGYTLATDAAGANTVNFGGGSSSTVGTKLKMFTLSGVDAAVGDWSLSIAMPDPKAVLERVFLLVRYTLSA